MPFVLPAFLLMAQAVPDVSLDVPLHHQRPSRLASRIVGLMIPGVRAVPNDERSVLTFVGPAADVEDMRTRVGLFDNAPRKARLEISVESPLDHADWKGRIDMINNETWKGDDGATGVKLEVAPRLNDDNTCTVFLKARSADARPISVAFRVKLGAEQTIAMEAYGIRPKNSKPTWLPRVSIRFLDALESSNVHP